MNLLISGLAELIKCLLVHRGSRGEGWPHIRPSPSPFGSATALHSDVVESSLDSIQNNACNALHTFLTPEKFAAGASNATDET